MSKVKGGKFLIPLNRTFWGREEERAAIVAIRSGTGVGDLSFSSELAQEIKNRLGVKCVLPTGSGTAALELACASMLKRGNEVILPSFTFTSCANAIMLPGAKPVFCDIDIKTYNIDPNTIEKKITPKTKAIMVVHYGGVSCELDRILQIAQRHKLLIIEDAAHALGAKYKEKNLGTIGDVGCFSFHGTKNVASGEGGFLVTNNREISKIAEIIREKGTDRSSFIRGERKKYSWIKVGRSLVLSDILAAIALEQIKKIEKITNLRKKNALYLFKKLQKLSSRLILPHVPEYSDTNWHIFPIRVPRKMRNSLIGNLHDFGVEGAFHYLPLHTSSMGKKLGYKSGDLPVTEEVAATLIRLPIYPSLKRSEMDYMVGVIEKNI